MIGGINMSQNLNSFIDIIAYINSLENEEQIKKFVMSRLEELENNTDMFQHIQLLVKKIFLI